MNIVCDKVLLSAAIDGVSKAVTMRSAIPVLEGILLKAEGFQLNLTGYDLEMGIVTTIEANVKEAGEVVLNAKLLSSMISRMPAGQVSHPLCRKRQDHHPERRGPVRDPVHAGHRFPRAAQHRSRGDPDHQDRRAERYDRSYVICAVSQDEKKPAHTGELFEILPDKLTVVALDGYRLAIVERPVTAVKDIRIIVPSKTMTEVAHLLPNDDEELVHISANRRYVVFMAGRLHHHEPPDRGRVPQLPQRDPRRQPHPRDHRHQGVHRDHRACFADYYRAFKKSPPHLLYRG